MTVIMAMVRIFETISDKFNVQGICTDGYYTQNASLNYIIITLKFWGSLKKFWGLELRWQILTHNLNIKFLALRLIPTDSLPRECKLKAVTQNCSLSGITELERGHFIHWFCMD